MASRATIPRVAARNRTRRRMVTSLVERSDRVVSLLGIGARSGVSLSGRVGSGCWSCTMTSTGNQVPGADASGLPQAGPADDGRISGGGGHGDLLENGEAAAQTRAEHTTEFRRSTSGPAARFPASACRIQGRGRAAGPAVRVESLDWTLVGGRRQLLRLLCVDVRSCNQHLWRGPTLPRPTSLVFPNERAARLQAARRWIWPSASELAGPEVELVPVAVGADMEGDVDTVGLATSADDLPLGRERRWPGVGVDVEAGTKPDRTDDAERRGPIARHHPHWRGGAGDAGVAVGGLGDVLDGLHGAAGDGVDRVSAVEDVTDVVP